MSVNMGTAVGYLDIDTSKFSKGLQTAASNLTVLTNSSSTVSQKLGALGSTMTSVGKTMTLGVTVPIASLAAVAVKIGASFDSAMSQVAATMGTTVDKIGDMRDTAIEMGSKTSFSATEAAEALNYLALAGYSSEEAIDALPTVLNLAAAGNMDLADASDMVTDALSALGLTSEDASVQMANMNQLSNQMAVAASHSNTSVSQLGEAILTVGGSAKNLKGGITEMNTVLGVLADNGIKGSEAGTHLRNVILAMNPTTDAAKQAFEELGVATYDAEGNLRSLPDIFTDLQRAMSGLTQEEQLAYENAIFNKTDLSAVNALLGTSTDRWNELGTAIGNASDQVDGEAAAMAETQLNNLSGDITILKSAFEGLMIKISDGEKGPIRNIIQTITKVIDKLNSLSDEQLAMVERIALVAAAIGPVLLVGGKLLTFISSTVTAIKAIKVAMEASKLSLLGIVGPIALVVAAIVGLIAMFVHLYKTNDEFREKIDNTVQRLKDIFTSFGNKIKEVFEDAGIDIDKLKEGFQKFWEIIQAIFGSAFTSLFDGLVNVIEGVLTVVTGIIDVIMGFVHGDLSQVKDGIEEIFEGIWEVMTSKMESIIEFFGDAVANILEILGFEGAAEKVENFTDTVLGIIDNIPTYVENAVGVVVDFFTVTIPNAFNTFVSFLQQIPQAIQTVVQAIIDFFTVTIPEAFTTFITVTVPQFVQSIITWFQELPTNIAYIIGYIIGYITQWGQNMLQWVATTIPQVINNIVTFFSQLPGKIWNWLVNAFQKITTWGQQSVDKAKETGQNFLQSVISFFQQLPGQIWSWLTNAISKAQQFATELPAKAREAGQNFLTGLSNFIQQVPSKISSMASQAIGALASLPGQFYAKGQEIIQSFINGIVSLAQNIASTISSIVSSAASGLSAGRAAASGNHSIGLDYVPYDGYVARLHKGEMVLTQEQAKNYNNGGSSSSGDTYNFYSTVKTPYEYARAIKKTKKELLYGI